MVICSDKLREAYHEPCVRNNSNHYFSDHRGHSGSEVAAESKTHHCHLLLGQHVVGVCANRSITTQHRIQQDDQRVQVASQSATSFGVVVRNKN